MADGNEAPQHGDDLLHVVVRRIGVHDHAIVPAAFVEIRFLEGADFNRSVHQAIVVRRREAIRREPASAVAMCHPAGRSVNETSHGRVATIDGIHQNLCQVEKCVLRIQLCAEGAGLISEDFVFDFRALRRSAEVPRRLVHLPHRKRLPIAVLARTQFTYWEKSRT